MKKSASSLPASRRSSATELNVPVGGGVSPGGGATSPVGEKASPRHSKTSTDAWVCPNDRQLALRAKLHSGWSVKTANLNQWKQPEPLSSEEQEMIMQVIEKADAMEKAEQQRVGKLVDRLEGMKRCRLGNGETECILCGELFRFYHRGQRRCAECNKMTCAKCGVDGREEWLCKICSEQREMWKKSGAWFFKGLPKYVLPADPMGRFRLQQRRFSHYTPVGLRRDNETSASLSAIAKAESSDEDEALQGQLARWSQQSHQGQGQQPRRIKCTNRGSEDEDEEEESASEHASRKNSRSSDPTGVRQNRSHSAISLPVTITVGGHEMSNGGINRCHSPGPPPIRYGPPPHGPRGPPPRHRSPRGGYYRPPMRGRPPFRPPYHRSPSPSPPYSPRGIPRRGGPPRGYPPRYGPPRPLSPQVPHRPFHPRPPPRRPSYLGDEFTASASPGSFHGSPAASPLSSNDNKMGAAAAGPLDLESVQMAPPVPESSHPDLTTSGHPDFRSSGHPDLHHPEHDSHDEDPDPTRTYSKAKPIGDKENKFTSTLRRLSTVRRRNKSKRKPPPVDHVKEKDNEENTGVRPSSTTSRESENEVVTSGYFSRQESQSRGSDETLSSPRTPEGSYGVIEFSLAFDETNELLMVNVLKAKKIKGMDINGLSDSYCKVTVLPATGKACNQQCTKTVLKSINPHYNATLQFPGISHDSMLNSALHFAVLDEDLSGDHLLAEASMPLKKVFPQMQKKFQLSLDRPNLRDTQDGLIVASNVGRVEVSLAFYSKSGTLKVTIRKCFELPPMDDGGTANPFVQVALHPVTKNSKHQTTVKWRTLEPEFCEQFVYPTSITELPKQSLFITVWDKEKGRQDEYIGGIILGLNAKGGRLQHWADVIKHPNQIHTKTHFLSANYLD